MPMRSSCSRMYGTAAAASGVLTVMRTSSEPAIASSLTWIAVPIASTVSVLVIACTRTGASPPIVTTRAPQRTVAWQAAPRRGLRRRDVRVGGRERFAARGPGVASLAHGYFSSTVATLSRAATSVTGWPRKLSRVAAALPMRTRNGGDAVERERLAGADEARDQRTAARVGDLDPRRRRRAQLDRAVRRRGRIVGAVGLVAAGHLDDAARPTMPTRPAAAALGTARPRRCGDGRSRARPAARRRLSTRRAAPAAAPRVVAPAEHALPAGRQEIHRRRRDQDDRRQPEHPAEREAGAVALNEHAGPLAKGRVQAFADLLEAMPCRRRQQAQHRRPNRS